MPTFVLQLSRRRWRLTLAQVVICCIDEMPKQYRHFIQDNNEFFEYLNEPTRAFISFNCRPSIWLCQLLQHLHMGLLPWFELKLNFLKNFDGILGTAPAEGDATAPVAVVVNHLKSLNVGRSELCERILLACLDHQWTHRVMYTRIELQYCIPPF